MTSSRMMKKARNKSHSSRIMKKASNKRQRRGTQNNGSSIVAIHSLPKDLLVEIVSSVASHSFVDLHNLKKCSKDFLDATEDNYVWQRVSLDTFPLVEWDPNEKKSSFLERCRNSENIESLYRQGLQDYFNYQSEKIDHGLEILKMAAQKGHKEVKYVYGMILLCSKDDGLRKQGLEHMRFLRKSKCVISSRKKVERFLDTMWKNNAIERNQSSLCNFKNTCKGLRVNMDRWSLLEDDDDDISLCEYCRWDHELESFYRLLNVD